MAIKTIDLKEFEKNAENVYEAVVIASRRARQINDESKLELSQRLEPVIAKETEDDTIMNQDKLNISLEFEKRTKPTQDAVDEMMQDKLSFRYRDAT
ncbi:MAG: DNA-directed RNA polymerase subunit omega [Ignavibacteriae bacterium]|jgi:DNA-directed RNA polymerase subunit K/omega|nr:DNA-directed RNA polymerase subunit omega [Ignavibacteriota bacterium]